MQSIRIAILFLATTIMLLHNMVPHEHESDDLAISNLCEKDCPKGLFKWLKYAFQSELGEGHLDHVIIQKESIDQLEKVDSPDDNSFLIALTYVENTDDIRSISFSNLFHQQTGTKSSRSDRGPPV